MMRARFGSRVVAACAVAALAVPSLVACAGGEGHEGKVSATIETPSPTREMVPLPPGAQLDPAAGPPANPFTPDEFEWEGSLDPRGGAGSEADGAEEEAPKPNVERIRQRGRIIVGIDQSLYLLSYRDTDSGKLRGLEVDLARAIAHDIFEDDQDLRVDFRFVDSAARTEALNSGEVDIIIRTMSITPERAEVIEFSTPYLTSSVRVLVPKDRDVNSLEDLAGRTACIVDGTNLLRIAKTYVPDSNILRTRSWSDCLMAVQQFRAEAIVADDAILAGLAAQDPHTTILDGAFATQYYGVGVAKGQDDLVRQVNATLERMRNDGSWYTLYNTWLGGSIAESSPPPLRYRKEDNDG